MSLLIILITASYFIVCFVSYSFLFKVRNLIGYHLGMNLAMSSSGVTGIAIGTILGFTFPGFYTEITIVTTVIAMIIGALFGALVDYQTLLSGISSGLMAGIMGPMIGVVADLGLITFSTVLVYFTFGLLCFSIRS